MEKIYLTYIEFARTILKLEGRCPENISGSDFFLFRKRPDISDLGPGRTDKGPAEDHEEPEYKESLPEDTDEKTVFLEDAAVRDGRFFIEIPTLAAFGEKPLPTGRWYLCAGKSTGDFEYIRVTDDLYDRIYQYEESDVDMDLTIDRSAGNYFHVYSRIDEENFAYCLDVEYKVPYHSEKILRLWKAHLKARHKARLHLMRKKLFGYAFRFFNKFIKKTGNRVLFTSDSRAEIGGNEKFIYDRMIERGMDKDYVFRFDFKPSIKSYRSFKSKILFTYYLATSDYIFVDDYQPEIYLNDYDPDVKIIQVWHACGAFKTVGFERLDARGAPGFNTRVHKCYTHVLVSSDHSAKHNAEAFAISRSKFYPTGVPRTDIFFDEKYKEETRKRMLEAFPQIKDAKKVILYAPTFRGKNARDAFFPVHALHFGKIGEYLKKTGSVMIIKMHPFVKNFPDIPEQYSGYFINASDYREVNDMLYVTDLLITDYSSVIYEASLLKIPMLFYAFDLKAYIGERGFYEPFEDIVPGKIVKTLPALLRALEEEDFESEKLEGFIEKNFKYTDGRSTDRAIDLIFGDKSDQ